MLFYPGTNCQIHRVGKYIKGDRVNMTEKEYDARNMFDIQVAEWKKRSECGNVCEIFGCEGEPTMSCPRCGDWYCSEHSSIHFHTVFSGL